MIRGVLLRFFLGRLIAGVCVMGVLGQLPWLLPKEADATQPFVLDPESFRHYVDRFNDEDEKLVTHDESQLIDLLDDLVDNYGGWEEARLTESGLFWQIDDRDGMEVSVGGSGKRATINSYVYGDATAIARIAELAGREQLAEQFRQKAATLKHLLGHIQQ